jgi:hypothetical protein
MARWLRRSVKVEVEAFRVETKTHDDDVDARTTTPPLVLSVSVRDAAEPVQGLQKARWLHHHRDLLG